MPPRPGDPSPGFMLESGRCWRMLYDQKLQTTHRTETPSWSGRVPATGRPLVAGVGVPRSRRRADGVAGVRSSVVELRKRWRLPLSHGGRPLEDVLAVVSLAAKQPRLPNLL
jgi:hypothetical protein